MNKLKEYFDMKIFMVMMVVLTVVFFVSGSSLALWRWTSNNSQKTNIRFTSTASFTCSANGGGDITSSNIQLQPAKCTDTEHAIKRKISYSSNIKNNNLAIDYKLYLDINDIGAGLLNSDNFRYAVTTDSYSCDSDIISSGEIGNEQITLFDEPFLNSRTRYVYLWIWLDEAEEDAATMNQSFRASLSGTCEVNENINKDEMLVDGSNFKKYVYTNLGTAYQTKTGLTDFNPETVTFYANGHLPEDISIEELNTYANVDVSYKQNGKIKAYYNNNNVYIYSDNVIYANVDSSYMFSGTSSLTLYLAELDTSNVTNMSSMFASARATTIDLSSFDTSKVTNMSYMLNSSQATTIDLSGFDTSKVTNMLAMFSYNKAITLDLSSFDTSNVINMMYMFYRSNATTLDLSSFDTSNVTNMSQMFYESNATTLDLSNFDISKVIDMSLMFYNNKATTLDLSSFDTSRITNMSSMFQGSQVTTLDLSSFDTSNVTDMSYMFYESNATTLDLGSFDTSKVMNMSYMFSDSKATTLDLGNFDTSNVIDMSYMFHSNDGTIIDASSFDISNVTDMTYMFNFSTAAIINISNMDLGNYAGRCVNMFSGNHRLTNLIVKDQASKDFILNNFESNDVKDSKISIKE